MKRVIGRLKNKKIVGGVNAKNYANGNTELVKEGNKIYKKEGNTWVELDSDNSDNTENTEEDDSENSTK